MDVSSSSPANLNYTLLDLQASQIDPEGHRLESGGPHRRLHALAATGRRPHRDHPASSRAAHLRRAPRGLRGRGDAVDLRAADAGRETLARLPFRGHERHDLVVAMGLEGVLQAAGGGHDLAQRPADGFVSVDLPLEDLPVVDPREARHARVHQEQALFDPRGIGGEALRPYRARLEMDAEHAA